MQIPNCSEFLKGCKEFERHEKRDAMYKVATFLISHFWGNHSEVADGLGVLLLTWNQAFYRYGLFDFDKLEKCLRDNHEIIVGFRNRDILTFTNFDSTSIKKLFIELLDVLQINSGKMKGRKSPVGVAKALHLLAPNFFPLWDYEIARAYDCYYNINPDQKYVSFYKKMLAVAKAVKKCATNTRKSLLKQIDEYNYSKYTQEWI